MDGGGRPSPSSSIQHCCHCHATIRWSITLNDACPPGSATALRIRLVLTEKIEDPPHADHTADAGETKCVAAKKSSCGPSMSVCSLTPTGAPASV